MRAIRNRFEFESCRPCRDVGSALCGAWPGFQGFSVFAQPSRVQEELLRTVRTPHSLDLKPLSQQAEATAAIAINLKSRHPDSSSWSSNGTFSPKAAGLEVAKLLEASSPVALLRLQKRVLFLDFNLPLMRFTQPAGRTAARTSERVDHKVDIVARNHNQSCKAFTYMRMLYLRACPRQ